jgi:1,4-dihydroxy-2-naphthoate octaprenyltransferase
MAGFGSKVGPYFRGFRPLDSLGYVVVVLIGAGSFLTTQGNIAAQQLLQAFLIAEALLGSIFILNNRFDYVVDGEAGLERASKNPISIGLIGLRESESLGLALMILGFLAVVLWLRNVIPILLYSITWILGVLYSAPPFRLKSRAGWDILSHAAVVLGLFIMGSSFANYLTLNVLVYAIPFLMLSTVYELRNHLRDWVVDSSAGLRTSI